MQQVASKSDKLELHILEIESSAIQFRVRKIAMIAFECMVYILVIGRCLLFSSSCAEDSMAAI